MITAQVAQLIAADRAVELQRHAATARLAALARCCRPSTWARTARRATGAMARLRAAFRPDQSVAVPCCA
jgi:hypothetical protein